MLTYALKPRIDRKMTKPIILGIETTCDDTGVGIYCDQQIVANIILSSVKEHQAYGGVVPEIAARRHATNLDVAVKKALMTANIDYRAITHLAVATEPGLPGCLHVGKVFTQMLGYLWRVPVININHLYAHIFSAGIDQANLVFPLLGIVVSGGHTAIYLVHNPQQFVLLEATQDDAIGEVYDKVGRALGFSYPAGPIIDKLFAEEKATITFMNKALHRKVMSYAGLKTAVLNYINQRKQKNQPLDLTSICSSFQKTIIDDLINRIKKHLQNHRVKLLAIGGGVSANAYLRSKLQQVGIHSQIAPLAFTNDNGAMHAYYAAQLLAMHNSS